MRAPAGLAWTPPTVRQLASSDKWSPSANPEGVNKVLPTEAHADVSIRRSVEGRESLKSARKAVIPGQALGHRGTGSGARYLSRMKGAMTNSRSRLARTKKITAGRTSCHQRVGTPASA